MDKLKALKKIPAEWKKCKTAADRKKFFRKLWRDYKTLFWYMVFGVLTTVLNVVIYAFCMNVIQIGNVPSNIFAWIFSVLFAYITNRKWVFESEHHTKKEIAKEICSFFMARGATGVLDLGIMFVTVSLLNWPDILMKIISNIIVIILNFILSKFLVFAKRKR